MEQRIEPQVKVYKLILPVTENDHEIHKIAALSFDPKVLEDWYFNQCDIEIYGDGSKGCEFKEDAILAKEGFEVATIGREPIESSPDTSETDGIQYEWISTEYVFKVILSNPTLKWII